MDSTLTIHVGRVFSIGNRWGIRLQDGEEIVGDGSGMEYAECEAWLDRIEKENEIRMARRHATPPLAGFTTGCSVGGVLSQ